MHQRINLRGGYLQVSDDPQKQRSYEDECERQREEQGRRGVRYALAPRQSLTVLGGRILSAGDEVRVTDFEHFERRDEVNCTHVSRPPYKQLEALCARGVVLEAYNVRSTPPEAA